MSQSIIPLSFEQYLQNKTSLGLPTDLNEIIFAYIPDLDLSRTIDRTTGLPSMEQWVYQQDIDQIGKSGHNAVVYSVVIPSTVEKFTFNAMFLRDKKVPSGIGMIVYKQTETKEPGMTLTKSMLMAFDGAAVSANVSVPVQSWQIDFSARLFAMDKRQQQFSTDIHGHSWFVDDGFKVADTAERHRFDVMPGIGYVGGYRAALAQTQSLQVKQYPQYIYLDAVFEGNETGQWDTQFHIKTAATEQQDYTDEQGQQHTIAMLALITDENKVQDLRSFDAVKEQSLLSQFLPYDPKRTYKTGEICTIEENGEIKLMQMYAGPNLTCKGKDPADITNRHDGWQDKTSPFWWLPYGGKTGMPFYWLDTYAPEDAVMEIGADLPAVVYWRLARTYPQLVKNGLINTGDVRGEFIRVANASRAINSRQTDAIRNISGNIVGFGASNGVMLPIAPSGAFYTYNSGVNSKLTATSSSQINNYGLGFDASKSVPVADENRPRNISRAMAIFI